MRPKYLLIIILLALASCAPIDLVQPSAQEQAHPAESDTIEGESQTAIDVNPPVQTGEGRSVEIIGGDEESLRQFVQRWLTPLYPGAPAGVTTVRMADMPPDLPAEIAAPEEARVIASVQEPKTYTQIILDADLTAEQVSSFYAQNLPDSGWGPAPQGTQGGFIGSGDFPARYCLNGDDAYLEVWAVDVPGEPTDVRLNLYVDSAGSFCQERGPGTLDDGMRLIPSLQAPAGVQMLGGGSGSSGDGSAYVSTDLETELSAKELLEHYNTQLLAARWELANQGDTPVVAWSTWSLRDEDGNQWGGTLFVMEGQLNVEKRFAMLSVERGP